MIIIQNLRVKECEKNQIQLCMTFTEKIVVAKISAKVKHSSKVIQFIYQMKCSVVALFSVNLMYSVNHISVEVMLHCIIPLTEGNEPNGIEPTDRAGRGVHHTALNQA